jgi:rhodanese-related sulfurtransferase
MTAIITPHELHDRVLRGDSIELIDVRTPAEFREVHVAFARNFPLDRLDPVALAARKGEPLYVICRSGSRGRKACETLEAASITVTNVEGGTSAWEQAGLPVVRGKKAISLERQVRIVIGLCVLIGSALTFFVHPYWIALPAFFGGGLIFSGVTDFCGLTLILGRMPWNQAGGPDAAASAQGAANSAKSTETCCR